LDRRRPPFVGVGGGGDDFAEVGNSLEKNGLKKPDPFDTDGVFEVVDVLDLGGCSFLFFLFIAAFAILFIKAIFSSIVSSSIILLYALKLSDRFIGPVEYKLLVLLVLLLRGRHPELLDLGDCSFLLFISNAALAILPTLAVLLASELTYIIPGGILVLLFDRDLGPVEAAEELDPVTDPEGGPGGLPLVFIISLYYVSIN